MRRRILWALPAALAVLLPGAVAVADAGTQPAPAVTWMTCATDSAVPVAGRRCGQVRVPLDWAAPAGTAITLSLHVDPATDPAGRVGALFINPGGPGGSATGLVDRAVQLFPAELRRRFDIIGLDPRGVGESTPLSCDPALQPTADDLDPHGPAAFTALVAHNRAFADSCRQRSGALLSHLDTVSVARDLEAVRKAIGEPSLNWLGFSYGTAIGNTYATLFPRHIRALASDGVLEHSLPSRQMLLDEARTAEDGFDRFVDWCAGSAACALHGRDAGGAYDALVARATATPIAAPKAGKPVTGTQIRLGTQALLLTPAQSWPALAQAIVAAENGDADTFASTSVIDPVQQAVECLDYRTPATSYAAVREARAAAVRVSPHLGGLVQSWTGLTGCAGWPITPTNPQHPLRVRGNPPILFVNSRHDPATSYVWATHVASVVPRSALLTYAGDGHTSYLTSTCVSDTVNRYLFTTKLPAPGSRTCPAV
jgi:pimeloyl-ACP methyl ester carboxylesterase